METVLFREATFDTGKAVLNYAEGPAAGLRLVMLHGAAGQGKRCAMIARAAKGFIMLWSMQTAYSLVRRLARPVHARVLIHAQCKRR